MSDASKDAFPRPYSVHPQGENFWPQPGMTLREWFAGLAMQGLLSGTLGGGHSITAGSVAGQAVACADALLAALAEGQ